MNIDVVKKSIKRWDQIRKTELGLTFLTSGSGFEVKKSEYEAWKKVIDSDNSDKADIHLYIGVLEFEIVFYLVDSISDKKGNYILDGTLFAKNFTKENLGEGNLKKEISEFEISDIEAAKRAFKWFLFSNAWASRKINSFLTQNTNDDTSGIVKVFTIPFNDFKEVLDSAKEDAKAFLFFGLTDMEIEGVTCKDEIEVILCSEEGFLKRDDKGLNKSENTTKPVPPFSPSESMNLLE